LWEKLDPGIEAVMRIFKWFFLTESNFYVKNFSFLIIILSKSLYKGHKFNEKYRKNLHFGGPTPRLIPGLTGIASKNPANLHEY
jgi:hypothetical protein